MKDDHIQRLFNRKDPPKPKPKNKRRIALFWRIGFGFAFAIVLFMIFPGSNQPALFAKLIMSVVLGGIMGFAVGFLRFKLSS